MRIIAGEARGRKIEAPAGLHTRPTLDRVRENLFNMIQQDVPGSKVLDLFAGSGALSLEALSRGAVFAYLADIDRKACETQKKNINALRYEERTKQFRCDWKTAVHQLKQIREQIDLVFLDPPYSMLDMSEVFTEITDIIKPNTLIILEHEAGKQPAVPENFNIVKNRAWGYCGITIYQISTKGV